jgi:hypothetical protein
LDYVHVDVFAVRARDVEMSSKPAYNIMGYKTPANQVILPSAVQVQDRPTPSSVPTVVLAYLSFGESEKE